MISLSMLVSVLVFILCSIVWSSCGAFTVTKIKVDENMLGLNVVDGFPKSKHECRILLEDFASKQFVGLDDTGHIHNVFSYTACDELLAISKRHDIPHGFWLQAANDVHMAYKGHVKSVFYAKVVEKLKYEGRIKLFFNKSLMTESDSLILEDAGIAGAFMGSLFTVLVCLLIAVPVGILSGICLQEFMPTNLFTHVIGVTINNLSAVPSVIFGILGLVIYIGVFGMPRSSSLVGGLILSLMMVPYIVVATKSAFAAVPRMVKDAAIALGASNVQVVLHHSLPIAMPGIVQGTLLSLARILGESSPLLMVGMVAFISEAPKTFVDPATVLPIQIYMWSSNPDAGFIELAAVAIMALLLIMFVLNVIVSFIRRKFDFFAF